MFHVRVLPDDAEPYEVEAKARDIVRWEAMDKRNSLKSLEDNLRMSDLFGLAYAACRRQQRYGGTYQEFLDTHDIEPLDEEGNAPQQAAASVASATSAAAGAGEEGEGAASGPTPPEALTAPAP